MTQTATNSSASLENIPLTGSKPRTIVTFNSEQSQAKVVDLYDCDGKFLGTLLRDSGITHLYTPGELAELQRRAASGDEGRTLREVLDSIQKIGEARQAEAQKRTEV